MEKTLHALFLLLMLTAWGGNVSAVAEAAAGPSHGLVASEAAGVSSASATEIEFETETVTVKEGEEDGEDGEGHWQEGRLLVVDTGYEPEEMGYLTPIVYSHEGDDIFESFDTSTGEFKLKNGSFGTATVTATYSGDEQYDYLGCKASYTVNYIPYKCTLVFSPSVVEVFRGKEWAFAEPTLTWTDGDGNVVPNDDLDLYYETSDPKVASVGSISGEVEFLNLGTATITVTATDGTGRELTASYTINYTLAPPEFYPTEIEFWSDAVTVKEGEEDGEHWQKGSLHDQDGYTPQEIDQLTPLVYSYEGDDIFESFDASTGEFKLKKGSFGTATVTATYKGDEKFYYLGSTASYTVTYREYKCTLAFSATEVNVIKGEEAAFTPPVLTLTDGDGNEVPLSDLALIDCESSNESVATIPDAYAERVVLHSPGTTTITATATDEDGRELTAAYTLRYRIQPELVIVHSRPDFDGKKTKGMANESDWVDGIIYLPYADGKELDEKDWGDMMKYESRDPSVVEVDTEGLLRFVSGGTTTITVTYTGTDVYAPATVSYTAECDDPTVQATFRFNAPARYGYGVSSGESHDGDIGVNATIVERGHINLACPTKTGDTPNRFYSPSGSGDDVVLELYAGTVLSVSTGEKTRISGITARGTKDGEAIEITGWTVSDDKSVATVEIDDDVRLSSLTVDYRLRNITIDEADEDSYIFLSNGYDNAPANASLKRKLVGGSWNTLSLPFDTEIEGSALEGALVKKLGSVTGNVLNFVDADRIEAGHPYLVKPAEDVENPTFQSVVIKPIDGHKYYDGESPYFFLGIVTPFELDLSYKFIYDGLCYFYGVTAGGKLARINYETTVKGMRAIFLFRNQAEARLNIDGEQTGIDSVGADRAQSGKVYNLEGQCVGNSLDGLPGGIYIVDGKKVKK